MAPPDEREARGGKNDAASVAIPPECATGSTATEPCDIVSAVAHTIRTATETVYGSDPCSTVSNLALS